jgi:hypothetical protein
MKPQMILVAGPYRSGTGGDPVLIERNLARLQQAALDLYRLGHMPMIGEWAALPLAAQAGSTAVGDAVSEQFLYPVAARMLAHCDAVLRIDGASHGADGDVRLAGELGLPVYRRLEDVPAITS